MPRALAVVFKRSLNFIQKVMIGGVFWTKFELFLIKIRKRILNKSRLSISVRFRFALVSKTERFSLYFLIARRQNFFN